MSDLDLAELRRIAEAATEGPWEAGLQWVFTSPVYPDDNRLSNVLGMKYVGEDRRDAEHARAMRNTEHIAAFDPTTVLALLDRLEAAEARAPKCDGGCSYFDGPDETCSLHGRRVSEVWEQVGYHALRAERAEAALARVTSDDMQDCIAEAAMRSDSEWTGPTDTRRRAGPGSFGR